MERGILKKGSEHLLQERPMRYNFILRNEDNYPVEKMCKCMKVSKNAYYHWVKIKCVISSESTKVKLMKRIRVIFEESRQIYGSCRIQKKLERVKA